MGPELKWNAIFLLSTSTILHSRPAAFTETCCFVTRFSAHCCCQFVALQTRDQFRAVSAHRHVQRRRVVQDQRRTRARYRVRQHDVIVFRCQGQEVDVEDAREVVREKIQV